MDKLRQNEIQAHVRWAWCEWESLPQHGTTAR